MIQIGSLVNNTDTFDYNYGMVIQTEISVTEILIEDGALDLASLEESCSGFEPPACRVYWDNGEINVHYLDELEVIDEAHKLME